MTDDQLDLALAGLNAVIMVLGYALCINILAQGIIPGW
jgi:hypothetical protein